MRKKVIALTLAACLIVVIGLTGCGQEKPYGKYDLSEYVTVGEYKGLEREELHVSVSDEEVDTQVKKNVEDTKTTKQVKEGKVKKGDTANIDYEGKIGGKAFDGGSASGYDLEIGSGSFIEGFEEGLEGKQIGSTQTLNLQFPKDYQSSDVAGKKVVFTVKINYVAKEEIPVYNDAWVAKNSDEKTTAEYEEKVKEELYKSKEETAKSQAIGNLWTKVVEDSKVLKYPKEEVNTYVEEIENQYESVAKSAGKQVKDLWADYGIESEEDYNAQNKKTAQTYVKEQMVMYAIAEKESLDYTDEEAEKLRNQIDQMGYTDETFRQNYGQDIESYITAALTFEKVGDFIYKNAKVAEKKPEKENQKDEAAKETTQNSDSETDADTSPEEDMSLSTEGADDATSNDQPGGADA